MYMYNVKRHCARFTIKSVVKLHRRARSDIVHRSRMSRFPWELVARGRSVTVKGSQYVRPQQVDTAPGIYQISCNLGSYLDISGRISMQILFASAYNKVKTKCKHWRMLTKFFSIRY